MRLIAAVLTGVLLSGGALACEPQFIESTWVENVIKRNPTARVIELTDEQRQVFMRNYNAVPPVTDESAEKILIFKKPPPAPPVTPSVLVVFFNDGCAVKAEVIPAPKFLQLLLDDSGV